ncbi:MAG: hypothetical protein KC636_26485 [Myxococcales bacterium]|nr:hypothetical protein [Myxococcales bacterium]
MHNTSMGWIAALALIAGCGSQGTGSASDTGGATNVSGAASDATEGEASTASASDGSDATMSGTGGASESPATAGATEIDDTSDSDSGATEIDDTSDSDSTTEVDDTSDSDSATEVDDTSDSDSATEVDDTSDSDSGATDTGEQLTLLADAPGPFTITLEEPVHHVPVLPTGTQLRFIALEFDMSLAAWRDDLVNPWEYFLIHLFTTADGLPKMGANQKGLWIMGMTIRQPQAGSKITALDVYSAEPPSVNKKAAPWAPGDYHVRLTLDAEAALATVDIEADGQPFSSFSAPALVEPTPFTLQEALADGLRVQLGLHVDEDEYHKWPLGVTFANVRVEGIEGWF